jgi:SAM-dependent methyltransferase
VDFTRQHSGKPASRMLRAHLVSQILFHTGAGRDSRMVSLGCGTGETELLLAPYVGEILGIDLSPAAVRQAREAGARAGVSNVTFREGVFEELPAPHTGYDAAIAIFFLLQTPDQTRLAARVGGWLRPGGVLFALDPGPYRLLSRSRTPDRRKLPPGEVRQIFQAAGFEARTEPYDFVSSPLAGLLPAWGKTYLASRLLDDWILRVPGLRSLGSNFWLIARKPR